MNTYIGTKLVKAEPLTRREYNNLRGWKLPDDENGDDEGYLVEYLDGGKANHKDFIGYISWSPKEQFDNAYVTVGDVDEMPAYQQRVIAEKAQLDARILALRRFIKESPQFNMLAGFRLQNQSDFMGWYSDALAERIAAF